MGTLCKGSIFLIFLFILNGCAYKSKSPIYTDVVKPELADGKYDSFFPKQPVEKDLEKIVETVKLITNLTFYQGYDFNYETKITRKDLSSENIKTKASKDYLFERPSSGTATVIYQEGRKVALLTCAHIVSSPDTLITYFRDELNIRSEYIQSVAIKTRETNNIIYVPRYDEIKVQALDTRSDLAILTTNLDEKPNFPIEVYNYGIGKAKELNWGTFVYVIGFPYGKKIISTALVSSPDRDKRHSFIVDATLHRGVSGGLILALRDGPPNFELIGVANAISGEREYILRPDRKVMESELEFNRPYDGEIYIDTQVRINYGITFAVSIESIREFIKNNQNSLRQEGFYLDRFIE